MRKVILKLTQTELRQEHRWDNERQHKLSKTQSIRRLKTMSLYIGNKKKKKKRQAQNY